MRVAVLFALASALATTSLAAIAPRSPELDVDTARFEKRAAPKCTANTQFLKNNKCVACTTVDTDAKTCSTTGVVTACKTKYLNAGKCVAATSCPSGTYANTSKKSCVQCTTLFVGSSKCTAKAATACASPYYLSKSACVKTCPSGTYAKATGRTCATCSSLFPGSLTCTSTAAKTCQSPKILVNAKTCQTPVVCKTGSYRSASNTCVACEANALTCSSAGSLTCKPSRYLTPAKKCVATCPAGSYLDTTAKVCAACLDDDALTCDSEGSLTCSYEAMIFTNVSISGPTRRTCVPACTYDNAYQPTPTTCQLCPYGTFADARATTPDSWRCNDCSRIDPDAESCATLYQSYEWGSPSPYIIKCKTKLLSKWHSMPFECVDACEGAPIYAAGIGATGGRECMMCTFIFNDDNVAECTSEKITKCNAPYILSQGECRLAGARYKGFTLKMKDAKLEGIGGTETTFQNSDLECGLNACVGSFPDVAASYDSKPGTELPAQQCKCQPLPLSGMTSVATSYGKVILPGTCASYKSNSAIPAAAKTSCQDVEFNLNNHKCYKAGTNTPCSAT